MKKLEILILFLALVLLCACSDQDELKTSQELVKKQAEEKEIIQKELDAARTELYTVRAELNTTKEELQRIQDALSESNASLEEVRRQYEALREYVIDISESGYDVDTIKNQIKKEQERKEAEEARRRAEEAKKLAEEEKNRAKEQNSENLYEQLARTPDKYKGKEVTFTGAIVEVIENNGNNTMLLAVHKTNGKYDTDQILYCTFKASIIDYRLLEKDIITIKGTSKGITTYKAITGKTVQIPSVKVEKIEMK